MIDETEFLNSYRLLSEKQKKKIFTEEQIMIIEKQISLLKMLERPDFYKEVRDVMAEEIYKELREEK